MTRIEPRCPDTRVARSAWHPGYPGRLAPVKPAGRLRDPLTPPRPRCPISTHRLMLHTGGWFDGIPRPARRPHSGGIPDACRVGKASLADDRGLQT
mgnify:CR=1 FL=1